MYAGTCEEIEFPNGDSVEVEFIYNHSNTEGFNYSKNGKIIEYCFDLKYKPDNMTIKFYNYQEVYVDNRQQGGGGSRWSSKKILLVDEVEVEEVLDNKTEIVDYNGSEEQIKEVTDEERNFLVFISIVIFFLAILLIWWIYRIIRRKTMLKEVGE